MSLQSVKSRRSKLASDMFDDLKLEKRMKLLEEEQKRMSEVIKEMEYQFDLHKRFNKKELDDIKEESNDIYNLVTVEKKIDDCEKKVNDYSVKTNYIETMMDKFKAEMDKRGFWTV